MYLLLYIHATVLYTICGNQITIIKVFIVFVVVAVVVIVGVGVVATVVDSGDWDCVLFCGMNVFTFHHFGLGMPQFIPETNSALIYEIL